jgi:FolB domain-containing protein
MPSLTSPYNGVDKSQKSSRDLITVTDLQLRTAALEPDHWQRAGKVQPLVVSLWIHTDVSEEAQEDALKDGKSLNYGSVTKAIEKAVARLPEATKDDSLALEQVAEHLAAVVIFEAYAPNVTLQVSRPRALLSAQSIGVQIIRAQQDYVQGSTSKDYSLQNSTAVGREDHLFIRDLRRFIVIGLNACERLDEQEVICDFEFFANDPQDETMGSIWAPGQARTAWREWRKVAKVLEEVR